MSLREVNPISVMVCASDFCNQSIWLDILELSGKTISDDGEPGTISQEEAMNPDLTVEVFVKGSK